MIILFTIQLFQTTPKRLENAIHRRAEGENVAYGNDVILTSNYQRGPVCMAQKCADCMAMFAEVGIPDLFITVTANQLS